MMQSIVKTPYSFFFWGVFGGRIINHNLSSPRGGCFKKQNACFSTKEWAFAFQKWGLMFFSFLPHNTWLASHEKN
jgi:hypothetical protein